jgi:hypothetical protein
MVKESLRPFEFGGYSGGSAGLDPVPWPRLRLCGSRRAEAPCNALPEVLDPLGQCLRTPAERRVHRRFVSAHRVLAGHDAFGQGGVGEVGAQACHSVGEPAHADADKRALFYPGQVFLTALHAADSPARRGAGSYVKRQRRQAGFAGRHARQPVGA